MVKAMKDKIIKEPVNLEDHLEELFEASDKIKNEIADLVDMLIGAMQDKSPLYTLSVFTNAAVKIVADNAPDEDYAISTLEGTTEAMKKSLQIMIEENVCGFQKPGGNYEQ
jgi:regulator of replication initiation timing